MLCRVVQSNILQLHTSDYALACKWPACKTTALHFLTNNVWQCLYIYNRPTIIVGKSVVSMEDNRHRMQITHDLDHQFTIVNSIKFQIALERDMWKYKVEHMQRPLKICTVWSTGSFSATVLLRICLLLQYLHCLWEGRESKIYTLWQSLAINSGRQHWD